ncbi:efflux RND transporter periplasmic adaptor subunit [Amphritea pacifica]|uniref:Efflux RND transporter periplasmic adaptor subunit n=1 Tax=Amphritea pacifica TaxID=2811233 RepID=A0ABS2W4J2_9GAMM|nr:efflux RND transporter periplasmic adaptor subunit [Amphritea pacifica]MBN0986546.1 efflux RND transporter periplasmic adaptor subunit [Amphritea pacifica]MBN1006129.1 efflux RND transporter periplasmic adaptor subunit [Amphritea pacifica]
MQLDSESNNDQLRQAWVQFSNAVSYSDYCQYWLELMCTRIDGVTLAALVLESGDAGFLPTAIWPEKSQPDDEFTALIEEGIDEATGLVHSMASGCYGVAFPIRLDDQLVGVVAVSLRLPQTALPAVMEQLQWGSAWIELLVRRQRGREQGEQYDRLSGAVDLLSAVLSEPRFQPSALRFVNELAAAFRCDRVSFGMTKRSQTKVIALSHSAQFGKKMNLIRRLSGVMDEAILQRGVINYNVIGAGDSQMVLREHAQFSQSGGNGNILTIPLHSGDDYFGAVTLERATGQPFDEQEQGRISSIVALSSEVLRNKEHQDSSWLQHLYRASRTQLGRLFGAAYLGRKLLLLGSAIIVLFFTFATGTYRVAADSKLEGEVRRAVVAPFQGYLDDALVKAGDRVSAGQVMSRLDDRDLTLEKLGYLSEQAKLQRQYEDAVAQRDRAEAQVLQAQMEQSRAQLELVDSKLQRTRLKAPFDGLVISGDLSQRLGGAVEQGEVLFEVAPLDSYRVVLWIDEHRMADIANGQHGRLVLNALPEESFAFTINRVTPVTEAKDGSNFFRVDAQLNDNSSRLRPGMEGVAKVEVDERHLIWIWTYPMIQWLKLKLWSWMP